MGRWLATSAPDDWRIGFVHGLTHTAEQLMWLLGFRISIRVLLAGVQVRAGGGGPWLWSVDGAEDASLLEGLPVQGREGAPHASTDEGGLQEAALRAGLVHPLLDRLALTDDSRGWLYFGELGHFVPEHKVVVVIACEREAMAQARWDELPDHSPLFGAVGGMPRSLIHAALLALFWESQWSLGPEGYRWQGPLMEREIETIAQQAGEYLMQSVAARIGDRALMGGPYSALNRLSALMYESEEPSGRLLLASKDDPAVRWQVWFGRPAGLGDSRAVRKLIELTSDDLQLVTDGQMVYGLGGVAGNSGYPADRTFEVRLRGRYQWALLHSDSELMRVTLGTPSKQPPQVTRDQVADSVRRLAPDATEHDIDIVWAAVQGAAGQRRGTIVVVTTEAQAEAGRLGTQGTPVQTAKMTPELAGRLTSIDGAILLAPNGVCSSIGTILDGEATEEGDPSRGARYNSAWRYYQQRRRQAARLLLIVVSEDGAVEMVPPFRPRLSRRELEDHLRSALCAAEQEPPDAARYEQAFGWLRAHASYLSPQQCEDLNAADAKVRRARKPDTGNGRAVMPGMGDLMWRELEPDPDFDPSYLADHL